ncbi:MAG: hypothetical protein ACKVQS_05150 [Fimbriimonadaceae bacterium]
MRFWPKNWFDRIIAILAMLFYATPGIDVLLQGSVISTLFCGMWFIWPVGILAGIGKWWSAIALSAFGFFSGFVLYVACDAGGSGKFGSLHFLHDHVWFVIALGIVQLVAVIFRSGSEVGEGQESVG